MPKTRGHAIPLFPNMTYFGGLRGENTDFTKLRIKKNCPTFTRVHEVDFGSRVPIFDDKTKSSAPKIFGSG